MNIPNFAIYVCLGFAVMLTACNKEKISEPSAKPDKNTSTLETPKKSLTYQMELLKTGDVEKLKACFTERLRSSITTESVSKGKQELSSYTLDDLFASEERGEYEGSQTCNVKMKNGRTLTTFVLQDGQWLADTVWFK
ncbi:MAG: hypothetical protein P8L78_13055 [Mariniblastus sp.]|nr:hypothetical protein [Mariniblastus sp.]MDG2182614.1 hypothetical protein [Mariniblastus sp.]